MIHEILPVGMLACNCSIFGDEGSREAIVVDPGDEIDQILAIRRTARAARENHRHHPRPHRPYRRRAKAEGCHRGAGVMNAADQELYDHLDVQAAWLGMETPAKTSIDGPARDGDTLVLGAAEFHVMHTPGHTRGSISLWIPSENKLVAGDTLFRESIGRTDLPGGNSKQILASIHTRLMKLPEDAAVIAGHGPATTIGHEKEFNPFLTGRPGLW